MGGGSARPSRLPPARTLAERLWRCARVPRLTPAPPPPQRSQPGPLPAAEAPTPAQGRSAPGAWPTAGCSCRPRSPLRSGSSLRARVGSETSPGGGGGSSERSCRRRRRWSGSGGNASAPRLPPCHWRAWSLPPPSFPSPRPRSPPPAPPAARLGTGPEEEPQAAPLPAREKREPRYFPVTRPWTPPVRASVQSRPPLRKETIPVGPPPASSADAPSSLLPRP